MHSRWLESAPQVIAHRGASQRAPENTIRAFLAAVSLGADAIELDAKLTRDGAVVVHHDRTLNRTTNGKGPLGRRRLTELEGLDAGIRFGMAYAGERIPTLRQVFEAVGESALYDIELSNYREPFNRLPAAVLRVIAEFGFQDRVLLSSFNPVALQRAKDLLPEIPRGLLLMRREPWWMRRMLGAAPRVHVVQMENRLAGRGAIEAIHKGGRKAHVWVVNEKQRTTDLLGWGVDGVITDLPELAREVIDAGIPAG
jgi:glycerophosphoryl diester phosphodiesterase